MKNTADVSGWSKRNVWRLPSGEMCVRPGMRKLALPSDNRMFCGGFSIRNEFNGEVWHYLFDVNINTQGSRAPKLTIVDEDFVTFQVVSLTTNRIPRVVTPAVVQGQILLNSPDLRPLWGLVGSGLTLAGTVASDDITLTALRIPAGICTTWVGSRAVIATGRSVFVSDPVTATGGSPRTFVAENQMELPGIIYGIHEAAGGMLVACTDSGVYGLDGSAASVGIIGNGGADWRLLNHHCIYDFNNSCVVRGRVYALTRRGYKLVDMENDDEVIANEPMMSIGIGAGRYALEDFRTARILGGEDGPIIGVDTQGAAFVVDVADKNMRSWWKMSDFNASGSSFGPSSLVGLLQDVDGSQLLMGQHGIYAVDGDFDGSAALSTLTTFHTGSLRSVVESSPKENLHPRHITYGAAVGGGSALKIRAAIRGSALDMVPLPDENGITIGVDSWGTEDKRYTVTPMTSVQCDFADGPTNDIGIEVGADGGMTRLSDTVSIDYSQSAPVRPQNKV